MPTVLISSDGRLDPQGPHVHLLTEAGFDVRYSKGLDFPRGHAGDQASIEQLGGVAAVLAWGERYTAAVLAALPELRVIARIGVGLDSVDVTAATERGIAVTITPTANREAVAEHTLALLFAVAKSIPQDDRATRAGEWPIELHQPIRGKTLGIVGLGRIGRAAAVRALGMGMKVIAAEEYPDRAFVEQHGIDLMDLDALLGPLRLCQPTLPAVGADARHHQPAPARENETRRRAHQHGARRAWWWKRICSKP